MGIDAEDPFDEAQRELFLAPADGSAPPRSLTATLDRPVDAAAWADLLQAEDRPGPVWLPDGSLLVLVSDAGRNIPYRVSLDGSSTPLVDAGRLVAAGVDVALDGRIALSAAVDARAGELYAVADGALRRITSDGARWQSRLPAPRWDERWAAGAGGRIQYWLASPATASDEPMPTILVIHGGPTGAFGPGGTLDSTLLAAHGYRVAMPNIRGSASFGSEWIAGARRPLGRCRRRRRDGGHRRPRRRRADRPGRLGVMGLSYGGFLTQWLIGVSDRFGAAVGENGVANQVSTWANSYFGIHYNRRSRLGDPLSRGRDAPAVAPFTARQRERRSPRRCSCSRPRRTGSAPPPTTSSSSPRSGSSIARSSSSSTPRSTTR